jgi:hypothetical protein
MATYGAVTPQKVFALSQTQPSGTAEFAGSPSDSIVFYDVTSIGNGATSGVFNSSPMFSVWMGYEIFQGERNDPSPDGIPFGNREEFSALTFNPANGTVYAIAFDSGSVGVADPVGDTQGDFDLYKIDYQALLKDYTTNSRPAGTVYAPEFLNIEIAEEQNLSNIASPLFDGTVDGKAYHIPHPATVSTATPTVYVPGAFQKIGELARNQSPTSFFDYQLDFVNPATLVYMDANAAATDPVNNDFAIRVANRVSTSRGAATPPPFAFPPDASPEGGYNSVNNTQSWNSKIAGTLQLDLPTGITSPTGWSLVKNNGVLGVWVADSDGGGDDIAFYELNLSGSTPTATKKDLFLSPAGGTYTTSIGLAENPAVDPSTNDGEADYLFVDKNGNLVVIESGYYDTIAGSTTPPLGNGGLTAQEPRVITVGISNYDGADSNANGVDEVIPAGPAGTGFNNTAPYTVSAPLPISNANGNDNDDDVTNTTRVAYDKSTGYMYIVDQDTDFFEDIYVFDPATSSIIYHELRPFDVGIFNKDTLSVFTRGDIDGSGAVNYQDILALKNAIADPTLGGTVTAALGAEWYDLTGDMALTAADLTELVEGILGTALGDFDLDGDVDGRDFLIWQRGGGLNASDLADWKLHYGFSNMSLSAQVSLPEPTTVAMIAMMLVVGTMSGRKRHV